jgi:hypothetical protein
MEVLRRRHVGLAPIPKVYTVRERGGIGSPPTRATETPPNRFRGPTVGKCSKAKKVKKPKKPEFECDRCGTKAEEKKQVCKPAKVGKKKKKT